MTTTQTPTAEEYARRVARALWQAECVALAHIIGGLPQKDRPAGRTQS